MLWHLEYTFLALLYTASVWTISLTTSNLQKCVADMASSSTLLCVGFATVCLHAVIMFIDRYPDLQNNAIQRLHKEASLANVACLFTVTVVYGTRVLTDDSTILCMGVSVPCLLVCNFMAYLAAYTSTPVGQSVPQWLVPEAQLLGALVVYILTHEDISDPVVTKGFDKLMTYIPLGNVLFDAYMEVFRLMFPTFSASSLFTCTLTAFLYPMGVAVVMVPAIFELLSETKCIPVEGQKWLHIIPGTILLASTVLYLVLFWGASQNGLIGTTASTVLYAMTTLSAFLQIVDIVLRLLRHTPTKPSPTRIEAESEDKPENTGSAKDRPPMTNPAAKSREDDNSNEKEQKTDRIRIFNLDPQPMHAPPKKINIKWA